MVPIDRRQFLVAGAPFALMAMNGSLARADEVRPRLGMVQAFDYDELRRRARALAEAPYVAPVLPAPETVAKIDFDAVQKIKFRPECALWAKGPGRFPVRLFHVNKYNPLPVRINELSQGSAREVLYSPDAFDYADPAVARMVPADLGYSGFRVTDGRGEETDWLAFQGASYFRSSGEEDQYGASARGIAINTAMPTEEEFPRFVEFWLAEPENGDTAVTIFALLDGPSITGAYRFDAAKGRGAVMDVTAELYARTDVARLGVAPLTSMYWYGANDKRLATDWRPEIHDSDGLAMWTGSGEHIWRPLYNPPSVRTNSFLDKTPKGFGLMQRDRAFESYQDDGAFYNRRPSMWVEPVGDWGEGAVQLVEIPTGDEVHDNVVAYWTPSRPVKRGDRLEFSYRLYWQNGEPNAPASLGRVVGTRTGAGGVPGSPQPEDQTKRKFVIDFAGGPLAAMAPRFDVTPVVTATHGSIDNAYVVKVVGTDRWRALFDLDADGTEPVDLRCYLRLGEDTLSETWIYQYLPNARA
jgi:periplasmic glucans biosynthesis protein